MTRAGRWKPFLRHCAAHGRARRTGIAAARGEIIALAALVALLALPTVVADGGLTRLPALSTVPPAYDRFLAAVRARTPPTTRLLVVDAATDPQHHLFQRTRYVLYPRVVVALKQGQSRTGRGAEGKPAMRWATILRRARHDHAAYVVVWAVPRSSRQRAVTDSWGWALAAPPQGSLPPGSLCERQGWGLLVQVWR